MQDQGLDIGRSATVHVRLGRLTLECSAGPSPERREQTFALFVPTTGALRFAHSGRTGVVRAGDYVLISQMEFHEIAAEAGSQVLILRIPAGELRGRLASVDDHVGGRFGANEQMTRLLVGLMRGIADVFIDCPPPNPEALATELLSFVALAIGAEDRGAALDVKNGRYRLRRRIFDYVDANLGDQDLSPRKIADANRISLSYLYSLFADDDTTVGQFLLVRRLQRAYEILVGDPKKHLTIAEIAYRVGFKNVSHFSRSFSQHFGMAPRDARAVRTAGASTPRHAAAHRPSDPLFAGSADAAGHGMHPG